MARDSITAAGTDSKLRLDDIRYLALEGGGGKGYAYLGALQLLEDNTKYSNKPNINVLEQLLGVAGTSAGAITALMVSLGMTASEIENEIAKPTNLNDFNDFFDPPVPRLVPQPLEYERQYDKSLERLLATFARSVKTEDFFELATKLQNLEGQVGLNFQGGWMFGVSTVGILTWLGYLGESEDTLVDKMSKAKPPLSTILTDRRYFVYLIRDMGFFSGLAARQYFDNLIATRYAKAFGGPTWKYQNITFEAHHIAVKALAKLKSVKGVPKVGFKDLMVCGANLSTGQSQLFSDRPEHTPKFPIADAVRISMSLPVAYKPYVIREQKRGWPPCGTYIDGGFWNNLPFREVNPDSSSVKSNTLALRLTIDEPARIETVFDIQLAMYKQIAGSGESLITPEFRPITIVLDTRDLHLLKLQPEDAVKDIVTKRSRRTVCDYFGWKHDKADEDSEDEKNTKELLDKSACKKLAY